MSEITQSVRSDCSVTDVLSKTKTFVYTWTINNFRLLYELEQERVSPSNNAPAGEADKDSELWKIDLYINGHPNYLYSPVHLASVIKFDAKAAEVTYDYFKLYVYTVDKSEKEHKVHESNKVFTDTLCSTARGEQKTNTNVSYSIPCLVKKELIMSDEGDVLADGNLILKFELVFVKNSLVSNSVDSLVGGCLRRGQSSPLVEFDEMLFSEVFSDAEIVVGEKRFPVHKVILAARSPVFAAMFQHGMRESRDNRVEIEDTEEAIVRELLRFLYTGRVISVEAVKFDVDLLAAANKYQIEQLKAICEAKLVRQLRVSNVISLLMHAEAHDAKELKSNGERFFKLHAKEIVLTESFEADFEALLKLLPGIFKALVLERSL